MSARGNGGTYHYYACTGRQKLGRVGCDGERIPRDKLESAVLTQLASLYRDGALIRRAVDEAAAREQAGQPALEERRRALAEEIGRAERALDRYYHAFEGRDLDSGRFRTRVSALDTRLDALREQDGEPLSNSPQRPQRRPTAPTSKPSPTSSSARSPRLIRRGRKPYSDC